MRYLIDSSVQTLYIKIIFRQENLVVFPSPGVKAVPGGVAGASNTPRTIGRGRGRRREKIEV